MDRPEGARILAIGRQVLRSAAQLGQRELGRVRLHHAEKGRADPRLQPEQGRATVKTGGAGVL